MTWQRSDKRDTEKVVCSGTCGQTTEFRVRAHVVRWWCSRCWKQEVTA